MAEYRREIGGVQSPSTQLTVKQPVQNPDSVLAPMLTNFATGAISGYASKQIKEDVSHATGASVSEEQVQGNLAKYRESVGSQQGKVTPEVYQEMSNRFLSEIDGDAKTALALVRSGDISSLHGEAFVRKQVGAAMANPFWAALGGRIQDAAGPLGGGRDVAKSAYGSAAMSELEALAEGNRKATQAYEEEVNKLVLQTKLPRENVERFIQDNILWEKGQEIEGRTASQNISRMIERNHLDTIQNMYSLLDPESNTLSAANVANMGVMLSKQSNDMKAYILSSNMSDTDKQAKIKQIDDMYSGYAAEVTSLSRTSLVDMMNKSTEAEMKMLGTKLRPYHSFLVANDLTEMANSLVFISQDKYRAEMESNLGKEGADEVYALTASQMPVLFGQQSGAFRPTVGLGSVLQSPEASKMVADAGPKFNANLYKQTMSHPVETMKGIARGPMIKAANTGDEKNQQSIVTSVGATVKQLALEMEAVSGGFEFYEGAKEQYGVNIPNVKPRIEMRIKPSNLRGPNTQGVAQTVIDVPEGMEDRGAQLNALYSIVKRSPWMWPEGATPIEAFNAIVNGDYDPKVGMGDLSPEQKQQAVNATGAEVSLNTSLPASSQYNGDGDTSYLSEVSDEELQSRTESMATPRAVREAAKAELDKRKATPAGEDKTSVQGALSLPDETTPPPSAMSKMTMPERVKALGIRADKTYHGEDAVEIVEAMEGPLSEVEKYTVMEEGFQASEYKDTRGIPTSGVGQTGKYQGMSFKATFKKHQEKAKKAIPNIEKFPKEVQAALYSSWYRGMLSDSPDTIKLINSGLYRAAATEFLDAEDYRNGEEGVKERMERVAEAIRSLSNR